MPDPGRLPVARRRVSRTVLTVALALLGLGASAASVYFVVRLAARERVDPTRCGAGLSPQGPRCCAPGQRAKGASCVGQPSSCPPGMLLTAEPPGCVVADRRIAFRGGELVVGDDDWQSEGLASRSATLAPFLLDAAEVTYARWGHCARAGTCVALDAREPGLPVTGIEPREAERYCRFAGGRLPTSAEWILAAYGAEGRRFPWGATGLVCRRAAFGLTQGPCARGGGLELAGSRPDGQSPDGVLDLAGNAAEWTLETGTQYVARGGSFRSQSALELLGWASEAPSHAAPWVGFRCAYDPAPRPR